jgi:hypothetical protein
MPRWVGVLLIASAPVSIAASSLPAPLLELGDYFAYIALIAIGLHVAGRSVTVATRRVYQGTPLSARAD